MTLKTKLLGAGAALLLSTGAALAVPATAQTDLNVRSGPGTQYPVVGSIQDGETVDVGSCTGSWCRVSFSGGSGYASRKYLAMGGGAPGPAVAAAPYVYDDEPDYGYGYYDDGYAYGPSAYIYANPRFRHRHHGWHGRPGWNGGGNWAGRPGGRAALLRSPVSRVAALPDLRPTGSVPAPGSVQARRWAAPASQAREAVVAASRAAAASAVALAAAAQPAGGGGGAQPDLPGRSCAAR